MPLGIERRQSHRRPGLDVPLARGWAAHSVTVSSSTRTGAMDAGSTTGRGAFARIVRAIKQPKWTSRIPVREQLSALQCGADFVYFGLALKTAPGEHQEHPPGAGARSRAPARQNNFLAPSPAFAAFRAFIISESFARASADIGARFFVAFFGPEAATNLAICRSMASIRAFWAAFSSARASNGLLPSLSASHAMAFSRNSRR